MALGDFSGPNSEYALSITSQQATFLHYDEELPHLLRAVVTGASGTPYAYGVFVLDLMVAANGKNMFEAHAYASIHQFAE